MMFNNYKGEDPNNPKKIKKPSSFNKEAFKHAISMVESSGGKFMWNKTSSATGKYQFLYNLIKTDPSMKGISRREFMNRDDLQELVMDRALDGKLKGFTYGERYANKLKKEFNSDYDVNSLTAMIHFLGPGNARKFLKDPQNFRVPGKVNLTGDEYISKFSKYFEEYNINNSIKSSSESNEFSDKTNSFATSPKINEAKYLEQQKDNIPQQNRFNMQDLLSKLPEDIDNYQSRQGKLNDFRNGGEVKGTSGADELVTLFEGGGTHDENPLGGIPQGIGANGKPNLVEEGETKWNDYIFSNVYDMDGNYTDEGGNKSNVFKKGGKIDPTDPPGPKEEEKPFSVTKQNHLSNPTVKEEMIIPDVRDQYRSPAEFPDFKQGEEVDFSKAVKGGGAQAFLDRYNHAITRKRMMEQSGVSSENIDNMILKGLSAKKQIGGNSKGSKASYSNETVYMGEDHKDNHSVETHERVHASGIDGAMGLALTEVLGNAFHQEGKEWLKKTSPSTLDYLNQPHEAYGNFSEFRSALGMKPGDKIDRKKLERLVKEKGLGMENFYRAYNTDKIVKALNTIAYQEEQNNNEYKLS